VLRISYLFKYGSRITNHEPRFTINPSTHHKPRATSRIASSVLNLCSSFPHCLEHLVIGISILFRISIFEFRIYTRYASRYTTYDIRNTKYESRATGHDSPSPHPLITSQERRTTIQFVFEHLSFANSSLFRISCFVFNQIRVTSHERRVTSYFPSCVLINPISMTWCIA